MSNQLFCGTNSDVCVLADAEAMNALKELGPSHVDAELRGLAPAGGGSVPLMARFLRMITWALSTCRDFELAHAYLALFLKVSWLLH